MRTFFLSFTATLAALVAPFATTTASAAGLCELKDTRQVLLSLTRNWNDNQGRVHRYQRDSQGKWVKVGQPIPVGIGAKGMAWGEEGSPGAPVKHEGDKRAPAGIFGITDAFGKLPDPWPDPRKEPGGEAASSDRPVYHQATEKSICVDAPDHPKYNQLLWEGWAEGDAVASHEKMLREDALYDLGLVVDYNMPPKGTARGSCIFIHVRTSPTGTTAGCTALEPAKMKELMLWIRPSLQPKLVQLPLPQYLAKRREWCLP